MFWYDGSKTVVKCGPNDEYDPEKGFAMAFMKRFFGNDHTFHKCLKTVYPEVDKRQTYKAKSNILDRDISVTSDFVEWIGLLLMEMWMAGEILIIPT